MGRTHSTRSRTALAVATLTASLALAGCSGGNDDDAASATGAPAEMSSGTVSPNAADETAAAGRSADAAATDAPEAVGAGGGIDLGSIGRDVIVELHVQMETDDIARSVAAITADAVNVGGGVASSDVAYGTVNAAGESNHDGHAVLVLKVPPAEVGRVLGNLDATGRVLSMNQSAQDVTDQLIDLDVRIENKRESVDNVRKMMEQTTDLNQLVTLEAELTWRLTELEQLEAQQRNLSDRVALSTITIEIRPTPATSSAGDLVPEENESIADAFRQGWDAFRSVMFGIAFVLAALAPFIVTASVVALVAWITTRIRRRPPQPLPTATAPEPTHDDELTPV